MGKNIGGLVAVLALVASACAQTSSTARVSYAPAGQAAQPGSWGGARAPQVATASGSPAGQAAQPGSWVGQTQPSSNTIYVTGLPAGRAAQPFGWVKTSL
jgi:hypothetical protein